MLGKKFCHFDLLMYALTSYSLTSFLSLCRTRTCALLQALIPYGCMEGMDFQVVTPSGAAVVLKVPPGLKSGDVIAYSY